MNIFEWPIVFACILLPFVVRWVLKPRANTAVGGALRVPFFKRVESFAATTPVGRGHGSGVLLALAFICFVVAGARPVWYGEAQPIPQVARQILLSVDVSGSMQEHDFVVGNQRVSRLDMVKAVVNDFLKNRTNDYIGMVLFGTEAYVYVPLTPDVNTVRQLFAEVDVGIAGDMTAIGDALALSVQQVSQIPASARIVILLSDGVSNAGTVTIDKAIAVAKEQGVTVYTIGIGSAQEIRGPFGINLGTSGELDEATLQRIATETGGRYFKATSTRDLVAVYALIDKLEEVPVEKQTVRPRMELFYIPLLIGLLLLGCAAVIRRNV